MWHLPNFSHLLHSKFLCLVFLFISIGSLQAQDWQEILSTTASDNDDGNSFGYRVDISGDYAIIGAVGEQEDLAGANSLSNAGAAYIFERTGGTWTQVQKLVAPTRAASDYFGETVAISGDYALVGAPWEDEDAAGANTVNQAGSVYVYERDGGGTWNQVQKLVASDRGDINDYFGISLSLSGDYAIIGSAQDDHDAADANALADAGSAYFFERNGGGIWLEVKKVVASDRGAGDYFGYGVGISGDYAVIGAYGESEDVAGANTLSDAGSAYIFERSGGVWSQVQKVVASDRAADDYFGVTVTIDGDYALIAAYQEDHDAAGANALADAGSAYMFERSGGGTWSQVAKLVGGDRSGSGYFGISCDISGDTAIVGAYYEETDLDDANALGGAGTAYVFTRDGGGTWAQAQKLVASDRAAGDEFGSGVALSGSYAVIGADARSNYAYAGLVYFQEAIPTWTFPHGGYALEFDGTDDYVDCGNVPFGSTMTIEAWIKTTDSKSRSDIISWGNTITSDIVVEFRASMSNLEFGINDGGWVSLSSNAAINDGEWHHVAASKNGSSITLYVDGVLDNTGTVGGTPSVNQTDMGVLFNGGIREGNSHFTGEIDEIRVWNDVRTQAEIQANMNRELVGDEANLAAYYLMYDSTGTSLTDNSTNDNTGTLTNGPAWKTSGALAGPDMAITTDGSEDYALATLTAPSTSSALTLEGWVNFNNLTGQQNLFRIHKNSNLNIRFVPYKTSGNVISLFVNDGTSGSSTSSFTVSQTNTWHHMAFTYNAGAVIIYVDGVEVANETLSQTGFGLETTNTFSVGADYNGVTGQFHSNANFDEIRIWSDVRTATEVRANMYHTLRGDEADLVAYYRCDQQNNISNNTLYDITANGNDATFNDTDESLAWVSSNPFNTWIGGEDSDWNNTDNWSLGSVPTTENIGIYAWSGNNMPTLANISGRDFYVDSDVTINSSSDLTLSGNFYNEGSYTSTGTTTFSGTANQSIEGTGTTAFGTMIVNNSAGVTMEKNVTANTSLTLTSGILALNSNTLTLGNGASVSGTPGNSNHVNATSGNLQKNYSGTGSFAYPVGDGSISSPITLNFTSGTFSSGNATVNLTTSKHPSNTSSSDFINRYWTVTSSGISSFSCSVSAQYDDGDIEGGATEADMDGGKWDGSSWLGLGDVTAGSNLISGTVSSFSDFTAGEPGAFPVELLNFTAKPQDGIVLLDWTTASEINSDYFSVERSADQNQWIALGEVGAAGFSSQVETYQYKDIAPLNGKSYYRLKQIDLDGSFEFSPVVEVSFDEDMISIYPNPVKDILTIDIQESKKMKAQLIDMQGRVVLKANLEAGNNSLSMGDLSPGIYTLQLKDGRGKRQEFQVVKE